MRATDPFHLAYDPAIGAVCVRLSGMWTSATVAAYRAAIQASMAETPIGAMPTRALYDVRDCQLHTKAVAEELEAFHARETKGMEHVAIVVGSALSALQAKRISPARVVRSFETIEAARAWLAERQPAIAA